MLGILSLLLWMGILPIGVGAIPATFISKQKKSIGFMWIAGTILSWAIFQAISVPVILTEPDGTARFPWIVMAFGGAMVLLALLGGNLLFWKLRDDIMAKEISTEKKKAPWKMAILWTIALVLVGFQLFMSVTMTYYDGDDAFYVAVSTITEASNTLYKIQPYSVGYSDLDIRHGLAPFPIWIAFLARVSGYPAATVAHVAVGTVLIGFTYVLFKKIGDEIFKEKWAVPVFVSFTSLLVLFGDYSFYTAENFMIARSRQGKAALGNIVIPMVIYLFLLILKRVEEEQKEERMLWILLAASVASGCLCSTLGTFLLCMFLGVVGVLATIVYRKWSLLWKTALCCIPAVIVAGIYFVL